MLFVWDTCRGDRITVNGYRRPTTPRLQELASRGVTFRQCFTPAPWTPPAHGSLFTGLLPRDHGLKQGFGDRIRHGIPILPETLRAAGYETVCIAANPNISSLTGLSAGFEKELPCYRTGDQSVNGEAALRQLRAWLAERKGSGSADRPFFLFVNLMDSHLPYSYEAASVAAVRGDGAVNGARRAAESFGMQEAETFVFEGKEMEPEVLQGLDAAYDGAILQDDRRTGEALDLLAASGLLEGAFVAVCGDHGENLGEHGQLNHLMSVYEPVLHVPLVARWPGHFEGGRVEEGQVRLQDLYPTILEAAGVPAPLRPRILVAESPAMPLALPRARTALPQAPAEVFEQFEHLFRAVREPSSVPGARKYVAVYRAVEGNEPVLLHEELYDIAADPGEEHDLLGKGAAPGERATADRLRSVGVAGR